MDLDIVYLFLLNSSEEIFQRPKILKIHQNEAIIDNSMLFFLL